MNKENIRNSDTLGILIADKRKHLSLTVREVARRSGLTTTTVSRIEQSTVSKPTPDALRALGRVLGIPTVDLFIAAGWMTIPTIKQSLRKSYPHATDEVLREMEAELKYVADKYGLTAENSAPRASQPDSL
ncbi:helix-turn-helix domain-containing protein [Nocardia sp. CA-119907]|uniref:helix-turn-helix domain-containing protein n=1 Tax=Nocardia sp. CA-119907 TaxID=3239973 RepID=UPI003D9887EC